MGRRRWQHYQQLLMENVHLKEEDTLMEEKDWESSDKCNFCDESSNTSHQTVDNIVPVSYSTFFFFFFSSSFFFFSLSLTLFTLTLTSFLFSLAPTLLRNGITQISYKLISLKYATSVFARTTSWIRHCAKKKLKEWFSLSETISSRVSYSFTDHRFFVANFVESRFAPCP